MGKVFDMDSPFMRVMSRIGDLLFLNIIMIICCIPVITAGAAFTAMHYVLLKIVRKEEGYLVRGFLKSFKQNFKQATIIWLIMLLVIAIFVGDFLIFSYSGIEFSKVFTIVFFAVAVVLLMGAVYVFPILARFDNTIKNTFKNAFSMAILNLPRTIIMVILLFIPFLIVYFSTYATFFVIMFGISGPALASAYLYSDIFKKFEPDEAKPVSDYDFSVNVDEENEGE
ncbi:MAG: YesL family protein [Lachnospiraceae bacterium]|nr:YesL family protein [Lachnospiraceae bacterium]